MSITPWIKTQHRTQLAPLWTISLTTDSGAANLSGLDDTALSMYFTNISTGAETQGAGTLHITSPASAGVVTYQVDTTDVVVGNYHVRLWVNFANGEEPFDLGTWTVEA